MSKPSKTKLKASTVRAGLSASVLILLGVGVAGFYWAQDWLGDLADETRHATVAANLTSSDPENQRLEQLQKAVNTRQDANNKSTDLILPSQNYQSSAIEDINKYASNNGISITNYSFESQSQKTVAAPALSGGVHPEYITITIGNPVDFTNLLRFLKALETNIPKLQLVDIRLSRDQSSDNAVRVEPLTIEVYVR